MNSTQTCLYEPYSSKMKTLRFEFYQPGESKNLTAPDAESNYIYKVQDLIDLF